MAQNERMLTGKYEDPSEKFERDFIATLKNVWIVDVEVEWTDRTKWVWPKEEKGLFTSFVDCDLMKSWIDKLDKRTAVLQAGGACGVFPYYLAQHFGVTYTFEPNAELFDILTHNIAGENVVKFQAALSNRHKMIHMAALSGYHMVNRGAYWVEDDGFTPTMMIDDIDYPELDMIILDLEGGECHALAGAKDTIRRHKPLIIVENKDLCRERFDVPDDWIDSFCAAFGYEQVGEVGRDSVLAYAG